ncbi:hypothetical protein F0562_009092 [Nyssa sinensis]|uniref:IBH1-like N-terminal domain-containing protein n=1 Tax=Nyssa sinensis TaxID=561372 RepID=A0A5J4ZY39_9ASTE|nr:hypothetical protein F0562_009092 [Nyssa sinensis]
MRRLQIVRYEVDMALALSSEGFAWSHALKDKLQKGPNEGKIHLLRRKGSCIVEQHVNHHSLPVLHLQNPLVYTKFCPNPTSKPKNVKLIKSSKRVLLQRQEIKAAAKNSEEEEKQITQRLNNLRNLLPGGNGMGVDEMLKEMGSYLVCLELQVNILRCLVETETR